MTLVTIDCDYVGPEVACAYLRVEADECAFVEANTSHATPRLLEALAQAGKAPESVRWIVVTHVHLDHAGGAARLMRACPNATLLAHPRAARHLVDPSRIIAGATAVYGAARFAELYGEIEPIDASRVRSLEDGERVPFGRGELRFHHTRGHANHHFVVHDPQADTVFTGDAFGLVYPRLQRAGLLAFPSTSPTDFDATAADESISRIVALGTSTVALTHFGQQRAVPEIATQLRSWLQLSAELVERKANEAEIEADLRSEFARVAAGIGLSLDADDWRHLALDLRLNAQGLAHAISRGR